MTCNLVPDIMREQGIRFTKGMSLATRPTVIPRLGRQTCPHRVALAVRSAAQEIRFHAHGGALASSLPQMPHEAVTPNVIMHLRPQQAGHPGGQTFGLLVVG